MVPGTFIEHTVVRFLADDVATHFDRPNTYRLLLIVGFTFFYQGLVAVDHLLSTVQSAAEVILPSHHESSLASAKSSTDATTPTNRATRRCSLEKLLDRARVLVNSVRLATVSEASQSAEKDDPRRKRQSPASCFRWSDGVLVEALERGDWIVLDGANLCSAR